MFTLTAIGDLDVMSYYVHKDLLCWYSLYFKKALRGSFKEADDKVMHLDDADVAGIFVNWLYTQSLPEEDDARIQDCNRGWTSLLTETYIFGDRYDVPELRKHAMDSLHYAFGDPGDSLLPTYPVIIKAFSNLPPTAPMCQFFIDIYARRWHKDEDNEEEITARADLPKDFLAGLMIKMADVVKELARSGTKPQMPDRSEYQT